jgi:hypothetical protein
MHRDAQGARDRLPATPSPVRTLPSAPDWRCTTSNAVPAPPVSAACAARGLRVARAARYRRSGIGRLAASPCPEGCSFATESLAGGAPAGQPARQAARLPPAVERDRAPAGRWSAPTKRSARHVPGAGATLTPA